MKRPKNDSIELRAYQKKVQQRLKELSEVLAQVSIGDFSKRLQLPKDQDEFSELYVGVQLMLDVMQDNLSQLYARNTSLAKNIQEVEAASHDIAQEKEVDEAILESIGEGLIVTDSNENIIIINKQAETMLGATQTDTLNKSLKKIINVTDLNHQHVPDDSRPHNLVLHRRQKVINSGLYFSTKKVKDLPVMVTATPIFISGALVGCVMVFRDVREEREIDKAKTEVVSFTSHQLRTPLSVINWYSEVLLAGHLGELSERQQEYVQTILFTARRMIELVNTFLSVSRIQLGTLVMNVEAVDVQQIIESAHEELSTQLDQKKIVYQYCVEGEIPVINGDPKLIRVVFQNLISNAVKYTPVNGTITIKVTKIKPSDSLSVENGLLISITDTGYGIPKKEQAKIFTKLFRAENAQQVDTEGAGLGLYMVKSIIGYAGGDIWFESKLKKGTTFYVALPYVPAVRDSRTVA